MTTPALPSPSGNLPAAIREEPKQRVPRYDAERRSLTLAFCRECLEWPEAAVNDSRSFHIVENRPRRQLAHAYGKSRGFQFDAADLGHIMKWVKRWCDAHALSLLLEYSPGGGAEDSWRARMAPQPELRSADACDALLRACRWRRSEHEGTEPKHGGRQCSCSER